ncbi:MAG: FAD-binding oxidoreductase [Woeseiaceae bacterium]
MTELIERLKSIVGTRGWTADPQELGPHLVDWRGVYEGSTPIMVSPASTGEVAAVVRACHAAGASIVPQGGNTGMCGGAVPDTSGDQVVVSLARMNRVCNVDADNFSIEVEAGCTLESVQRIARQAHRFFPLSLSAEGTCQIGGNIATNAGGINVGRYGTARALVMGLEVVLADGTILDTQRALRKDTAGYDIKQLFIGSEGTLGIITAATLRLFPEPGPMTTALLALETAATAVAVLANLKTRLHDRVESFELFSNRVAEIVEQHIPDVSLPFGERHPWYVLMDAAIGDDQELLNDVLMRQVETQQVLDVVIAKNAGEADRLWRLRHSVAEAERKEGRALKHDVSVPLSRMGEFLERGDALLASLRPDLQLIAFGHVGDGNLHYNVVLPRDLPEDEWMAEGERITVALYDLVNELGGSFSAEHGVGQAKKVYLRRYRGGAEFELMKLLKKGLDPANTLNPGKIF